MAEEKGHGLSVAMGKLGDEELAFLVEEVEKGFLERDFSVDIDAIELEFVGQTPRLTGNIEINFEVPGKDLPLSAIG